MSLRLSDLIKATKAFDLTSAFSRGGFEPGARPPAQRSMVLIAVACCLALIFAVAGAVYAMRPVTLRIAVGPPGSDDAKVVQTIAQVLARERGNVRLRTTITAGVNESAAALEAGTVDLAVLRGDIPFPKSAQTVATLRKNVAALWVQPQPQTQAKGPANLRKGRAAPAIETVGDLAGKRVGIIGRTPANIALLNVILGQYGVAPEKVEIVQFGTNDGAEAGRSDKVDAILSVGPTSSRVTADAVAGSSRHGVPVFLDIDASETIAQRHPLYEAVEIPAATFGAAPSRPTETVKTIGFGHHIVARNTISDSTIGAFTRQLFSIRQAVAAETPDGGNIETPDTDKDAAIPVHPGAAAYVDGEERTFLDKYSDYMWGGLLLLSALGSAGAWFASYRRREERNVSTGMRDRLLDMLSEARRAETSQELDTLQGEADQILRQTVQAFGDEAIDDACLRATDLVLQRFHDAVADRRTVLADSPVRGPRPVTQIGL